jgi:hypothetical protein
MNQAYAETFDKDFFGQRLETTHFDTGRFALRRARRQGMRYLTLRLRCYRGPDGKEAYALSAKTESEKWRAPVTDRDLAHKLEHDDAARAGIVARLLPGNLLARLQEITESEDLLAVVCVKCRRYAVEDRTDRYTLDTAVMTDTGKCLPACVLEYKSTVPDNTPGQGLAQLGLRPIKLSKFLWATTFAR